MTDFSLTAEACRQYHDDGYLGPFELCAASEMELLKPRILGLFDEPAVSTEPKTGTVRQINPIKQRGFCRHHDNPFLYALITRNQILDRACSIMGHDLLLWRSMFFIKEPGEKRIPWHQDLDDWPIEPYLALSAWIAIDETTADNGCVEIVPGSHRDVTPMVPSPDDVLGGFARMADPACFSEERKVSMKLKPGQFFIFNERVLHQSAANNTRDKRIGLAVRFIPPIVRVLDPYDQPILVRGQDKMHFNRLANNT